MTSENSPVPSVNSPSGAILENTSTKNTHHYQNWLKKKYLSFDAVYHDEVDELIDKLKDMGIPVPEYRIVEFAFITDWIKGKISSKQCATIFGSMDMEQVANVRVIRKFTTHMFKHEDSAEIVKQTIANLKEKAVPVYLKYLVMLKKYFQVLAKIDDNQIPVTWLEQNLPDSAEGTVRTSVYEMPFNQFVQNMDYFIVGAIEKKYFLGDNVVIFDEVSEHGRLIHWIFAPKSYIERLKELYNIKEAIKEEQEEREYLNKLIKAYSK